MRKAALALLVTLVASETTMAGELKDDLIAMEKKAWMSWGNRDGTAFKELLTEDAVQAVAGGGVTSGREKIIADVNASTCKVVSFDFSDVKLRHLGSDIALLSYTATQDATCGGKKLPPKVYSTSVYVHKNGKWKSTNYQETPID
jgi:uncharacterized protein (TIGR02246 family)